MNGMANLKSIFEHSKTTTFNAWLLLYTRTTKLRRILAICTNTARSKSISYWGILKIYESMFLLWFHCIGLPIRYWVPFRFFADICDSCYSCSVKIIAQKKKSGNNISEQKIDEQKNRGWGRWEMWSYIFHLSFSFWCLFMKFVNHCQLLLIALPIQNNQLCLLVPLKISSKLSIYSKDASWWSQSHHITLPPFPILLFQSTKSRGWR